MKYFDEKGREVKIECPLYCETEREQFIRLNGSRIKEAWELKNRLTALEEESKNLRRYILHSMEKAHISSITMDGFKVAITPDCDVNHFDSKSFERDYPRLFQQYSSQTCRDPFITIRKVDKR